MQFGRKPYDLKSQVRFQTKIARHEVELPFYYIHFEIAQFYQHKGVLYRHSVTVNNQIGQLFKKTNKQSFGNKSCKIRHTMAFLSFIFLKFYWLL